MKRESMFYEEDIKEAERILVDLYKKEIENIENELTDLLKETEKKAAALREQIAEHRRFINAIKLKTVDDIADVEKD